MTHKERMKEKADKILEGLEKGESVKSALRNAGYSEHTANRGLASIPKGLANTISRESRRLIKLRRSYTLEDMADIAIGRLILNCQLGKDGGVMSAKTLGSHKELALWQPDSQVGVIVLNTPSKIEEKASKILEAEE